MRKTGEPDGLTFEPLSASHAGAVREMTFASYRHLLKLERSLRHPPLGGNDYIRPFGVVALRDGSAIGLALAEAPETSGKPAQLLSLFVRREARRQGVARELLGRTEDQARVRGFERLEAVFTVGKPGVDWFVKLIRSRGWTEPEPSCLVVHLEPGEALESPAFREPARRRFGRGIEVFPWAEMTPAEERALRESNEERRWIEPALEPWRFPVAGLDLSSVGARHEGAIVGWLLNHRVAPGLVRISAGFMRGDLARKGKVVPLLYESLERVRKGAPGDLCTFITTFSYPSMIAFVRRRVRPVARFVGESRKSSFSLL